MKYEIRDGLSNHDYDGLQNASGFANPQPNSRRGLPTVRIKIMDKNAVQTLFDLRRLGIAFAGRNVRVSTCRFVQLRSVVVVVVKSVDPVVFRHGKRVLSVADFQ